MRCDLAREALSARLDGELGPLEDAALDAHLEGCAACRTHDHALAGLHRAVRVRAAEAVPDLTRQIMAATAHELPTPRPATTAATAAARTGSIEWARWGLFTVAFTQLVLALPLILGEHSPGDAMHSIRELGAFGLALSVGMLVVVWQPHRASGLLPMAVALAAGLAITAAADILSGRSGLLDEAPHLLELSGVLLLWRLVRTTAASPPSTSASTSMPAAA